MEIGAKLKVSSDTCEPGIEPATQVVDLGGVGGRLNPFETIFFLIFMENLSEKSGKIDK